MMGTNTLVPTASALADYGLVMEKTIVEMAPTKKRNSAVS